MEALKVESLSKDFGGLHAVRNVSFSVAEGERLAIIGPNGAGKTTLFNLLNGQLTPTAGRVYFFGQDITRMTVFHRVHLGIARSFQVTSLFLNLSVMQNMLLALQGMRPSRYQMFNSYTSYEDVLARAKGLLVSMGLLEKRSERVKDIAHGEQRKIEIALSLASEPKLLLLDEPSCGLTAVESTDIISRIRNLGKEITVIVVAHDMDLIFGVAERIIVLHYGEIIAEGTCDEIRCDLKVKEIYMGSEERK